MVSRTDLQKADLDGRVLDEAWGPRSIDCFVNYYNTKFPRSFHGIGTHEVVV